MANFEDKNKEQLAEAERLLRGKSNTLGKDGSVLSEPFVREDKVSSADLMMHAPSADAGLVAPNYDDLPNQGAIGTRYETIRLHSYLPSGLEGPSSIQTFIVIGTADAPISHNPEDIEDVRLKPLISPRYSQGKANAAHSNTSIRGFELALYPAMSTGGPGSPLAADTSNGPISPAADPSAGPPDTAAPGIGDEGFWTVDYDNGIVRFSHPPLNGSNGVMNPNNVFGDIEGTEVASDAYGAITMFATFYHYTGEFGTPANLGFMTVGDGYVSEGIFTGAGRNTIQAAIEELPDSGGTVFIKEGNYDYTEPVIVPKNVRIVGLGGVFIQRPTTEPAFIIQDGYVTIEGVEIQPRRESIIISGGSIELRSTSASQEITGVTIKNCVLYGDFDTPSIAFAPEFDCTYSGLTISNNLFEPESGTAPVYIGQRSAGGAVTLVSSNITDNIFQPSHNQTASAITLTSVVTSINGLKITNNGMNSPSGGSIAATISVGSSGTINNLIISDNHMSGTLTITCSTITSAIIKGNTSSTFSLNGIATRLLFADNIVLGTGAFSDSMTNCIISGNSFTSNASWCNNDTEHLNAVQIINNNFGAGATVSGKFFDSIFKDGYVAAGGIVFVGTVVNSEISSNKSITSGMVICETDWIINSVIRENICNALVIGPNIDTTISSNHSLNGGGELPGVKTRGSGQLMLTGGEPTVQIGLSRDGGNWGGVLGTMSGLESMTIHDIIHDGRDLWVVAGNDVIATSPNGIFWTIRHDFGADDANAVAYNGKNLWVAVGDNGNLATSSDGTIWINRTSSFGADVISDVAHDGVDTWVAVGFSGKIATSSNGFDWIQRTNVFGSSAVLCIAHNGRDLWIAGSSSDEIAISPDGINWTLAASAVFGGAGIVYDIVYNDKDLWVAVGEDGASNGTIATSPDGTTWTVQVTSAARPLRAVDYNGSDLWVAVGGEELGGIGSARIYTSSDGVTWTEQSAGVLANIYAIEITHSATAGVIGHGSIYNGAGVQGFGHGNRGIGIHGFGGDGYAVGVKGVSGLVGGVGVQGHGLGGHAIGGEFYGSGFGSGVYAQGGADGAAGVKAITNGGLLIAVGNNGKLATSNDGIVWSQKPSSFGASDINTVAHNGKGLWVAGGDSAKIATSADGINWTQRTSGFLQLVNKVAYGKDLWVAGSGDGSGGTGAVIPMASSPDGVTWTLRDSAAVFITDYITDIAHNGKDLWVAVGYSAGPRIITSPDGIVWTRRSVVVNPGQPLNSVGYNGRDLWIAGDNFGSITTSPDGINWSAGIAIASPGAYINAVVYNGKDLWLAAGAELYTSPDGVTWTQQVDPFAGSGIQGANYNSSFWTIVSGLGEIATSPDGVTWTLQNSSFGTDAIMEVASIYGYNAGVIGIGSDSNGSGVQGFGRGDKGAGVEGFGGDGYAVGVKGVSGLVGGAGVQGHGIGGFGYGGEFYGGGFGPGVYAEGGYSGTAGVKGYGLGQQIIAVSNTGKIAASRDGIRWEERLDVSFFYGIAYNGRDLWMAVGVSGVYTSPDGIVWTIQPGAATIFGSNAITSVEYANGFWIVTDQFGLIATSPDGVTWTSHSGLSAVITASIVYDLTYNKKDLFVAAIQAGQLASSIDSKTWVRRHQAGAGSFYKVTYGNNLWIAVGGGGGITNFLTSTDGITWLSNSSAATLFGADECLDIAYNGKDLWVAVGGGGKIATSPSGITWTLQSNSFAGSFLFSVAHNGKDMWIVGSADGKIATSPDGVTWTQQVSSFLSGDGIYRIATIYDSNAGIVGHGSQYNGTGVQGFGHGNNGIGIQGFGDGYGAGVVGTGGFLGGPGVLGFVPAYIDGYGASGGEFFGGATGSGVYAKGGGAGGAGSKNYGQGTYYVAVGGTTTPPGFSQVATSTDGINWVQRATSFDTNQVKSVAYNGKDLWVAAGNLGRVLTSPDGINWTQRTSGTANELNKVAYGNDLWVIPGFVNTLLTSSDGITWTPRFIGTGLDVIYEVAYNGKDLWVSVGNDFDFSIAKVMTSPDGITWTHVGDGSFGASTPGGIAYGNGLWIAVADAGQIATSPDGVTWTQQTSGSSSAFTAVAHNGKDLWVVAASDGTILTSPEGIDWTPQVSSFGADGIYDVIYSGKNWLATGTTGKIATSPDGVTWTQVTDTTFPNTLTVFSIASVYGSNAGVVAHGSEYNGTGVQGFGHGNNGIGIQGFGDGYGAGVMGLGGRLGGPGVFGSASAFSHTDGYGASGGEFFGGGLGSGVYAKGGSWGSAGIEAFGNGTLYIGVNTAGIVGTSTDAINWVHRANPFRGSFLWDIAYNGKDLWMIVGQDGSVATSPDGMIWTRKPGLLNFIDEADDPILIRYGSGFWVALITGGLIATSSDDGDTWVVRDDSFDSVSDIFWNGKDLWMAVGSRTSTPRVISSPDCIHWSEVTGFGTFPSNISNVHYFNGTWILGGGTGGGTVAASMDGGFSWKTTSPVFSSGGVGAIAHNGKDLWVIINGFGATTSPDGITWTQQTLPSLGGDGITSLVHNGKDLWVGAGADGRLVTSPDGVHWTLQTTAETLFGNSNELKVAILRNSNAGVIGHGSDYNGTGIIGFGGGTTGIGVQGIAADGYGTGVQGIGGSLGGIGVIGIGGGGTDGYDGYGASGGSGVLGIGVDEGAGVIGIGGENGIGIKAFGGGVNSDRYNKFFNEQIWVAVSNTGQIGYSEDGYAWTQAVSPFAGTDINDVAFDNKGMWVAVGDAGKIANSTNGINWTLIDNGVTFGATNILCVAYGKDLWVACGASGKIAVSTDGSFWTLVENGTTFASTSINGVAYGNGLWIAVANSARIGASIDGETWTMANTTTFGGSNIRDVAHDRIDRWVAVGDAGKIASSTDGFTWFIVDNAVTFPGTSNVMAVDSNRKDLWVAVGGQDGTAGRVAVSSNGISWQMVDNAKTFDIRQVLDVSFGGIGGNGNGRWMASTTGAAPAAIIGYSDDGLHWMEVQTNSFEPGVNSQINGIAAGIYSGSGLVSVGDGYYSAGVKGIGIDGPGLIAQNINHTRSAFHIVPQSPNPSSYLMGDMYVDEISGLPSVRGIGGWVRLKGKAFATIGPGAERTTSGTFDQRFTIPILSINTGSVISIRAHVRCIAYTSGNVHARLNVGQNNIIASSGIPITAADGNIILDAKITMRNLLGVSSAFASGWAASSQPDTAGLISLGPGAAFNPFNFIIDSNSQFPEAIVVLTHTGTATSVLESFIVEISD